LILLLFRGKKKTRGKAKEKAVKMEAKKKVKKKKEEKAEEKEGSGSESGAGGDAGAEGKAEARREEAVAPSISASASVEAAAEPKMAWEDLPEQVRRVLRRFTPPLRAVSATADAAGRAEFTVTLRNPKTGAPMPNTAFYAAVGSEVFVSSSDERGVYKVRFYPKRSGSYYVVIAVQDFEAPADSVLVNAVVEGGE